jgi:nitric oxide reductase NorD protein
MPSLLTKSPEGAVKENEKEKKPLSMTFDENGIRPKDEDLGYDSLQNEHWSNKLIHLNSYISDKRELEYKPDTFLYHEWGNDIGCYRTNWARVNEQTLSGKSSGFYREVMHKHAGLVKKVKREFQMLRPEGLAKLKRRLDGEEIDLDSTVEYFIDKRLGITPSEKNYIRIKKSTRDIAVSFLVDMSGSTRGSTINLEKEALVIMSEALCELGDAFSIYGFSGHTREKVDFFIIKEFSDLYDQKITRRISEIKDNYSTRIGPAIRHSIHKLMQRNEKIKMLILLSDGKPEDKDYYDNYAIEDTRIALKEGQKQGVRPFCITVDNKAPEYLHRMYSHSNGGAINDVSKLPLKITRIYKKLTT